MLNICVIGDVVIDWLTGELPISELDDDQRIARARKHYTPKFSIPVSGGAWFVTGAIRSAMKSSTHPDVSIYTYDDDIDLYSHRGSPITQSTWSVGLYPSPGKEKDETHRVFRLKEIEGYYRHSQESLDLDFVKYDSNGKSYVAKREHDVKYDIVVIDDLGLAVRDSSSSAAWRNVLAQIHENTYFVLLISGTGLPSQDRYPDLWNVLKTTHKEKTAVIVSANALRYEAVISRRISWESTGQDFVKNIKKVESLLGFKHIMVRFGVVGAICHHRLTEENFSTELYYDPGATDGIYRDREIHGEVVGGNSLYVSWVVRAIAECENSDLQSILAYAGTRVIKSGQKFYNSGYGDLKSVIEKAETDGSIVFYNRSKCFHISSHEHCPNVKFDDTNLANDNFSILTNYNKQDGIPISDEDIQTRIDHIAFQIVYNGLTFAVENKGIDAPVARFGQIIALDRVSIQGFRRFERIIRDYINSPIQIKPLNLAVFGEPGAGKSFAVEEIAGLFGKRVEFLSCNLTHIGEEENFISKQLIRLLNFQSRGKLPLIMIDEFDCSEHTRLKDFIDVMETGKFQFAGETLCLGKCIFVFAGGMSENYNNFKDFCAEERHKSLKAPDFHSRLRGFLDIRGVNYKLDDADSKYHLHKIRRAILLRSYIEDQDCPAQSPMRVTAYGVTLGH